MLTFVFIFRFPCFLLFDLRLFSAYVLSFKHQVLKLRRIDKAAMVLLKVALGMPRMKWYLLRKVSPLFSPQPIPVITAVRITSNTVPTRKRTVIITITTCKTFLLGTSRPITIRNPPLIPEDLPARHHLRHYMCTMTVKAMLTIPTTSSTTQMPTTVTHPPWLFWLAPNASTSKHVLRK